MIKDALVQKSFEAAKEVYESYGVDVEKAMKALDGIQISMHCWQGDDVTGLEGDAGGVSGGIMATGNYPGKARNGEELRADIDKAMALIPGKNRLNLHASYAELEGEKVDRNAYETRHFQKWIDWAKKNGIALDFNPTTFGHPMASDDLTLSNPDDKIRRFWIDHCKACRKIGADMGAALGSTCIDNIWVQDGIKDIPADRLKYRQLLKDSLDEILSVKYPAEHLIDAVESKLFGVGVESFTVGSNDFYMNYAASARARGEKTMITFDMGHFHPTESIADKLSAMLPFADDVLLHVTRNVRWDSDHVVIQEDVLMDVMREIKRAAAWNRIHIATDFFDASINRVAAWVIGVRATKKAALAALLEPTHQLVKAENEKNGALRLALTDEFRGLPVGAIWNQYCLSRGVPAADNWTADVAQYEKDVLAKRG